MTENFTTLAMKAESANAAREYAASIPLERWLPMDRGRGQRLMLPVELIADPWLIDLMSAFAGRAVVLRLAPHEIYKWHRDRFRLAAVNMRLDDSPSKTLIAPPNPVEVSYGDYPVLLNTQVLHCVMNYARARLTLSVGFTSASYGEILAYCKNNGTVA